MLTRPLIHITVFFLLITALPAAAQAVADSFLIRFDSLVLCVKTSANQLTINNQPVNRPAGLTVEYHFTDGRLSNITTAGTSLADSSKVCPEKFQTGKQFRYACNGFRLNARAKNQVIRTITFLNGGLNKFSIDYYFENGRLDRVFAQDQSPRFVDTINKYHGKKVVFTTTIDDAHPSKSDDEYWLNGYLVAIDEERMQQLKGKKARITGRIVWRTGVNSPDRDRWLSNKGEEEMRGGFGNDVKMIPSPKIEVLDN